MAVAFDAVGPSSAGAVSAVSATALSWTHVCGSSAACLVVAVVNGNAAEGTDSVTYAGVPMTRAARVYSDQAGGNLKGYLSLWTLLSPATGSNTVQCTFGNSSTSSGYLIGGSVSYTGVGSVGTAVTASGTTLPASVSVSTASTTGMVAAACACGSALSTTSGTRRWEHNVNGFTAANNADQQDAASTGGTVTLTFSGTSDWSGSVAVELLPPSGVPVSDSDASGAGADGGESVSASLSDTDGTGAAADAGEQAAASLADADASSSLDAGEALAVQSFDMAVVMPSPAWLTRWGRPLPPRQLPLQQPGAFLDQDYSGQAADGGEGIVNLSAFAGSSAAQVPPAWKAAYRHTSRPAVPAFFPDLALTVTVSLTDTGFTQFQGGSVLQVYVLNGATQFGGASDAEAIANLPGTGTITPAFSGSFIPWACFNDSQVVSANAAATGNALDVNIPGSAAPVGAAGHYTGPVTAGIPVSYGLSSGASGDAYVLAAVEVPPLNPGTPVTLDGSTQPGVSDNGSATSLTSPAFAPSPGSVLVAVYGANNGGSADSCTFEIQDSRGLAWTLAAVVNSGGSFLAAVWTATVPTFALADADAAGPALDFVSSAADTGQPRVPDTCHGADGGEQVSASLSSADTGHGTESDPAAVTVVPVTGDASGGAADASTVAPVDSDASQAAADGGEVVIVGADGEGQAADGGEQVTASVFDAESGHGTESDPSAVRFTAPDASGAGADGGEFLAVQSFARQYLPASPSFRARFRHTSRPVMSPASVFSVTVTDAEAGHGQDAEIDNPFPVDAEPVTGTDAGETVTQSDSDASQSNDITFEFESCRGTDLELTAWPSDEEDSLAFDPELGQFTVADADASGAAADGGEAVQKNVPVAAADASGAAADAGEHVAASLPGADSGTGADGGEFIPEDSDAAFSSDGAEVASGLFTSSDFSLAFDVESRVFGPNNAVSDSDASGAGADAEQVDVYAYQPLFRWTGGYFDVPFRREGG